MADLNPKLLAGILIFSLPGCGDIVSREDHIKTDTYISSVDQTNHSDEKILKISKSEKLEERSLIKLPTGNNDSNQTLQETLKAEPQGMSAMPFMMVTDVLVEILSCKSSHFEPSRLVDAKLIFHIVSSEEIDLSDKLKLQILSKPWWHSANWEKAHPFSLQGIWTAPGGDVDPKWSPILSMQQKNEVIFDIQEYFKSLLDYKYSVHYGFIIQSALPALKPVILHSTQTEFSSTRPKMSSSYRCPNREKKENTYYLSK